MTRGLKKAAVGALFAAALVLPVGGFAAQEARADPTTLTVRAGDGETGYAVNEFLPENVVVTAGDTVTWEFPWYEPHTVTFGQPTGDPSAPTNPGVDVVPYTGVEFVSSGLIFGSPAAAPVFSMRFDETGTFPYVCIIHPFMTGSVTVLASDFERDTQEEIDAEGEALYDAAITELKSIASGLNAAGASVSTRADGTKLYDLTIGPPTLMGDVMQFFPASTSIKTGDTIRWTNDGPSPHTVTFNIQDAPPALIEQDIFEVPPQKPAATFDGTGFWHSGIVGAGFPDGTMFEMTFSKAGAYEYICVLHADQGMVGSVTVTQATTATAPLPPNTGSGVEAYGARDSALLISLTGAIALIVVGSATAYAVKR